VEDLAELLGIKKEKNNRFKSLKEALESKLNIKVPRKEVYMLLRGVFEGIDESISVFEELGNLNLEQSELYLDKKYKQYSSKHGLENKNNHIGGCFDYWIGQKVVIDLIKEYKLK